MLWPLYTKLILSLVVLGSTLWHIQYVRQATRPWWKTNKKLIKKNKNKKRSLFQVDLSKLDMNKPDEVMAASKKGQTVMMFVKVTEFVERADTEAVTMAWETGLNNAHINTQRFLLEEDRSGRELLEKLARLVSKIMPIRYFLKQSVTLPMR